jgi:hypothetical protein
LQEGFRAVLLRLQKFEKNKTIYLFYKSQSHKLGISSKETTGMKSVWAKRRHIKSIISFALLGSITFLRV